MLKVGGRKAGGGGGACRGERKKETREKGWFVGEIKEGDRERKGKGFSKREEEVEVF